MESKSLPNSGGANMIEQIIGVLIIVATYKLARKLSEPSEIGLDAPEPLIRVPIKREVAIWRNGKIESWTKEY